jgi:hypothetical protein
MCFVENEQQLISVVCVQPSAGLRKYLSLDRPKHHVFEHRVIGNKEIWRMSLHLMAR